MTKNYIVLLFSFLLSYQSDGLLAQSRETCGQEVKLKRNEQEHPASQKIRKQLEENFKTYSSSDASTGPINIPMKAYIVRQSNGSGGISVCDLQEAINVANVQYSSTRYNIVVSELVYIDNDVYYNIDSDQEAQSMYESNNDQTSMNVYFVNYAEGYCGWAYLPGSSRRYVVMKNSCALNTSTLAHEIGHYLGLSHTHAYGDELVDGSNCATAGDRICDTPADPNLSGNVTSDCQYIGTERDANGQLYMPDPLNLMSYSRKACRDIFTPGQAAMMDYYYDAIRGGQLTNSNIVSICCADDDNDGVCNTEDQCPGLNDNMIGLPCDDGDTCTTGETYNSSCNCSGGVSVDSDGDGVCDVLDICEGHDDNIDSDGDGIPDGCDDNNCMQSSTNFAENQLAHSGSGSSSTSIDFGVEASDVAFVISDLGQKPNGNSSGRYIDLVKVEYIDVNGNTATYGTFSGANTGSVNVQIAGPLVSVIVTLSDGYDGSGPNAMSVSLGQITYCGAPCSDSDGDGVCDGSDVCPGFDDNIDSDGDGIPDGCDPCYNQTASFSPDPLNHSGTGTSTSTLNIINGKDISFSIGGLGSKVNGNPSGRYIDAVTVTYEDGSGNVSTYGTFYGNQQNTVSVNISGVVTSISVGLSDNYDGNSPNISIDLGAVSYCPAALADKAPTSGVLSNRTSITNAPFSVTLFPNPTDGLITLESSTANFNIKIYQ